MESLVSSNVMCDKQTEQASQGFHQSYAGTLHSEGYKTR